MRDQERRFPLKELLPLTQLLQQRLVQKRYLMESHLVLQSIQAVQHQVQQVNGIGKQMEKARVVVLEYQTQLVDFTGNHQVEPDITSGLF
jgi:hypothetical protein